MNSNLSRIQIAIKSLIEINNEEWSYYSEMFSTRHYKKKEILLLSDNICDHIFFINKGLLRIYFIDKNGNESTFYFSQENDFSADYESFINRTPSNYTIEAMEDSEVVHMSYKMVVDGYKKLQYGEKLGRLLAEKYFIIFSRKIQNIYTKTPYERYILMNTLFPNIRQRVPQHYIASYLNISSVHLSRLINKKT
ncbi:MAG: cyclic nucleotide-binding domain-containing protein [Flavobacteriaceae bacterium]|nr:cyclic nucleotide-binding domain-containing protein [Flavobacteriaceae bacterium]